MKQEIMALLLHSKVCSRLRPDLDLSTALLAYISLGMNKEERRSLPRPILFDGRLSKFSRIDCS